MLELDGSAGEGGGQILRSALALALVTGTPFRIHSIRARRANPGLQRQHLTCVLAARELSAARVVGAALGSRELTFEPGEVRARDFRFDVESAGSTVLVAQTVLPALWRAPTRSRLELLGGTHNPAAPTFEFFSRVFLPALGRVGVRASAKLLRHGFYPKGGGRITIEVEPTTYVVPLTWLDAGAVKRLEARVVTSGLEPAIAERERHMVANHRKFQRAKLVVDEVDSDGPGNFVSLVLEREHATEVCTSIGARGVRAEIVARHALEAAERWLAADVPVGEHLADQLLLPLALAGGGEFRTLVPSEHTRTNADVIAKFLPVGVTFEPESASTVRVRVAPAVAGP
ncbi:MAG: RNA 3'-terminal phosphate cyclase [Planctomycetes bacterium]|nr:RNA 3'-terminal phosphate cyclase [Planctomycetota bacterium]